MVRLGELPVAQVLHVHRAVGQGDQLELGESGLAALCGEDEHAVGRRVAVQGHAVGGVLLTQGVGTAIRFVDECPRGCGRADVTQGAGGMVVDAPDAKDILTPVGGHGDVGTAAVVQARSRTARRRC